MMPCNINKRTRRAAVIGALACLTCLPSPTRAQDQGVRGLAAELLNAKETSTRRKAAQGLGRVGTGFSIRVLSQAMGSERRTEIRLEVVRALRTIAFQRNPGYREALRALGRAADDALEQDDLVRLRATEALWEAGRKDLLDPVPFMESQLQDRSQRIRMAAVFMLRKNGSPAAAEALGRAVINTSLSQTVRLAAIDALGAVALSAQGIVGRQVATTNIATTNRTGVPPLHSPRALELRHERQIAYLAAVVRDPSTAETLTLKAVKSMGRIKDHAAIPVLQELIETHRSLAVRKQATGVLSHVLARQYE